MTCCMLLMDFLCGEKERTGHIHLNAGEKKKNTFFKNSPKLLSWKLMILLGW